MANEVSINDIIMGINENLIMLKNELVKRGQKVESLQSELKKVQDEKGEESTIQDPA